MEMIEKTIESVSDYIKIIEHLNFTYHLSKFLYRGESKSDFKLLPSVYRTIPGERNRIYNASELSILRDFISEASSYIHYLKSNDLFEYLEYAQHYGVPTRFLDWTSNPLVSLFFACQSNINSDGTENDGKVYLLNMRAYTSATKEDFLTEGTVKTLVINMLQEQGEGFHYPKIFKPYYIDDRMKAQASYFMAWGADPSDLESILKPLWENKGFPEVNTVTSDIEGILNYGFSKVNPLQSVVIPHNKKSELLRQLDTLSINDSYIFPGLDGIGKSIRYRHDFRNSRNYI